MKTVVIYAYCDIDVYSRRNAEFFLENGIVDTENVDYYFICNGKFHLDLDSNIIINKKINKITSARDKKREKREYYKKENSENILNKETLKIVNVENVNFIERENKNYDFGAWNFFLTNIHNSMNYKNYIFLNNSVIGPILPRYTKNIYWTDLFTTHLNNEVKIVGCTKNYEIEKHIQSYCFAVDKIGLNILIKNEIFNYVSETKIDFIKNCECKMLKIINDEGYKEYTFENAQNKYLEYYNLTVDSIYKKTMFINFQLFEFMFVKPRHLDIDSIKYLENFYDW